MIWHGVRVNDSHWSPGTQILWCYGDESRYRDDPRQCDDVAVDPMTVVRDDENELVAWMPAGTPRLAQVRVDGRSIRADEADLFTAPRKLVETTWRGSDVLRIHPAGAWWSVWVFFEATTKQFEGWYVNIEDPHTRSGLATHTRDHVLDVDVQPDRSHQRKDEDELILAVEQGRYHADEARQITSLATQVEAVIDAWGSPFCDGWESWTPDPAWSIPGSPTRPGSN